jgi:hypothetical protein
MWFALPEASFGRILSVNADGSGRKSLSPDADYRVAWLSMLTRAIYWTNMGVLHRNDGSIECADLDGRNRRTIVPEGSTFTPKQLHLEKKAGKLHWCDREVCV